MRRRSGSTTLAADDHHVDSVPPRARRHLGYRILAPGTRALSCADVKRRPDQPHAPPVLPIIEHLARDLYRLYRSHASSLRSTRQLDPPSRIRLALRTILATCGDRRAAPSTATARSSRRAGVVQNLVSDRSEVRRLVLPVHDHLGRPGAAGDSGLPTCSRYTTLHGRIAISMCSRPHAPGRRVGTPSTSRIDKSTISRSSSRHSRARGRRLRIAWSSSTEFSPPALLRLSALLPPLRSSPPRAPSPLPTSSRTVLGSSGAPGPRWTFPRALRRSSALPPPLLSSPRALVASSALALLSLSSVVAALPCS